MERDWQTYDEAEAEEEFLEPLVVQGEEFFFPKTPPALPYFKLLQYEAEHGEGMPPHEAAIELLPDILDCLDDEKRKSLLRKIKATRLTNFALDVLIKWGWFTLEPAEVDAPNQVAPPPSTDSSTDGSGRSKQTSSLTTASV